MADDMDWPHEALLDIDDWTVASIATAVIGGPYLAGISGGLATWILRSDNEDGKPIAVIAQQWEEPAFLLPDDSSFLDMVCDPQSPRAYVQYCAQVDPRAVHAALRNGEPLPKA